MSTAKGDVEAPLEKLCTLEDIQYHLYVLEKVRNGIAAAEEHGSVPQEKAEARLAKWTTKYEHASSIANIEPSARFTP